MYGSNITIFIKLRTDYFDKIEINSKHFGKHRNEQRDVTQFENQLTFIFCHLKTKLFIVKFLKVCFIGGHVCEVPLENVSKNNNNKRKHSC